MTTTGAPVPYADPIRYGDVSPIDDVLLPPDPRRSLHNALQMIWRWRLRFCLVLAAAAILGGLLLLVIPLLYTAQALVMVGSREPSPLLGERAAAGNTRERELDVDGAIQLITSPVALRRMIQDLNLEQRPEFERAVRDAGPGALVRLRTALFGPARGKPYLDPLDVIARDIQAHMRVDRVGRSTLVKVAYTAANPELAAEIANALASNTAVDNEFVARLTVTERVGFDLLKAWVVSPAGPPSVPSSPNIVVIGLATLVAGLGAAFSAVLFADYYATGTVLTGDQIARRGVRALGFIPVVDVRENDPRSAVTIVSKQPGDAFSDSIASLRASLTPLIPQGHPSALVLMFASALPFEGKSTTVAALAASFASSGGRVLVIDADLRSPDLHLAFGAHSAQGLGNCLDNKTELDSLIQVDRNSGVSLLAAGPYHPRPLDVLTSARLRNAIENWRKSFDFILIDVPPVLAVPDARFLVPYVDYCVFVVRWGKTGWETINHGLRLLTEAGARIAGVAVSRVDGNQVSSNGIRESGFYGQLYRYSGRTGL